VIARLIAGTILLAVGLAQEPTRESLLLSDPVHVAGTVVDQDGKPVAGAEIGNAEAATVQGLESGESGSFSFDSKAPYFVLRKEGFRSERVAIQGAPNLRVILYRLSGPAVLHVCADRVPREGLRFFWAAFWFAKTKNVVASKPALDTDYLSRVYYLNGNRKAGMIEHGSGPMWSAGTPSDEDVWKSVKFEEVVYSSAGTNIIDARGEFPDGKRWRSLGRAGESAAYDGADPKTAKAFDQFLDSACLKPRESPE
jgi:hypothetical protein